ncbi:hypothetical protein QFC21_003629 [Naganishia friedmannii]|uniref:Uncharacterized protein n=1 Tax=Naganishia friedmannii TaxID=89922 RepID=A0ACC2VME1_9TREE|nr:hypothetical protein QFC21_003629 [Naganishia friedmannii]
MQRQQPLGNLRFTAPIPSIPAFPNGFQSPFSHRQLDFPSNRTGCHPTTIHHLDAQAQSLPPPGYTVSAPPSALISPALPNEVYFSPFAHEYTSYFSLEVTEPPAARRNTPFVHRRSRVVMACTYCRRRKIRCDGGDPCTNCAKTCRSCDYTSVPANLNNNRRRRALTESHDISPPNIEADHGEVPSVFSKKDVSTSQPLPTPVHSLPKCAGQRTPGTPPTPHNIQYPRINEMAKQVGYTADPPPPSTEPVLLSSGFSHMPPTSVPGQQMQWALVPVWGPDVNEHVQPQQLTAPITGFGSSRMMHNHIPSLNIPQMDPSTLYHQVSPYQLGNIGNPFSATVPRGFAENSLQLRQANSLDANVRDYATYQLQHHTHGMASATNASFIPHQFPTSAEGPTIGQGTRHLDAAICFSSFNGLNPPSAIPLEPSNTNTSFSSQGSSNTVPMQACGSSVASPPYTPLPQSAISGYAATGHDMFRQQQEELQQLYAPAMMMHIPPVTPALASPIKQHNYMSAPTGMVGLGIMMPGM